MRVGFLGLGNMGLAMARNLLKAGYQVIAYNRTRSRAETLQAEGATVASTISDACQTDVVITMLADDEAVVDVAFQPGGIISSLAPGTLHVSMSTISPALTDRLTEAHAAHNQALVAAPVFGRPQAAAEAKLFVIAAGQPEVIDQRRPLFTALSQKMFVVGPKPSEANVVKLAGNFLIASLLESFGEAFALVRKSGIDPNVFLEIVTGTLFTAPIHKTYGSLIAEEKYTPPGFKLPLGLKDIRLALATAESHNVPMPLASLIRDHFIEALAHGYQDLDWSAVALVCAKEAGL